MGEFAVGALTRLPPNHKYRRAMRAGAHL
jgi:hypothetical protein